MLMNKVVFSFIGILALLAGYMFLRPYPSTTGYIPKNEAEVGTVFGVLIPFEFVGSLSIFRLTEHGDTGYVARKSIGEHQINLTEVCVRVEHAASNLGYVKKRSDRLSVNKSYATGSTCWFTREVKSGVQLIAVNDQAIVFAFED
jgi:hypothetical protein